MAEIVVLPVKLTPARQGGPRRKRRRDVVVDWEIGVRGIRERRAFAARVRAHLYRNWDPDDPPRAA